MPLSLKCQIDKLEHKGQITKEEHQALLKKLDGHDKQIKSDAIDDISDLIRSKTYKVVGMRFDNTYEMHDRALGRLAKNVLIEELLEELEQLKEQKNE